MGVCDRVREPDPPVIDVAEWSKGTRSAQYRLADAATGEFERGHVRGADMVTRRPWADDLPVHVDE